MGIVDVTLPPEIEARLQNEFDEFLDANVIQVSTTLDIDKLFTLFKLGFIMGRTEDPAD